MRSVYISILFDFYLYLIIWFITKFWLNVGNPQISLSDDEKYAKMLQEEECMCFFYRCFRLFYLSNTSFKKEVGGDVQLFFCCCCWCMFNMICVIPRFGKSCFSNWRRKSNYQSIPRHGRYQTHLNIMYISCKVMLK